MRPVAPVTEILPIFAVVSNTGIQEELRITELRWDKVWP
jgi:hypothetical protein